MTGNAIELHETGEAFTCPCAHGNGARAGYRGADGRRHEADARNWQIALADMTGDAAILKAMKTNEDDTVTA